MEKFKTVYSYDENGYFVGESFAQFDKNGVVLMPANTTDKKPLKEKSGFNVVFNGDKWEQVKIIEEVPEPEPVVELTWEQKRLAEYPTIDECVHAILDGTLDDLQEKRAEVKEKYPKD